MSQLLVFLSYFFRKHSMSVLLSLYQLFIEINLEKENEHT